MGGIKEKLRAWNYFYLYPYVRIAAYPILKFFGILALCLVIFLGIIILQFPRREGDSSQNRPIMHADERAVNPESTLSFESVAGLEFAGEAVYRNTVNRIAGRLIAAYENEPQAANEQATIAYIAAMSENGQGTQALSRVPAAFRDSTARAHLSAPYFASLEQANQSIAAENAAFVSRLTPRYKTATWTFSKRGD